jgi:4-amino-4-deoxy-L-arabinose transferase-like glycosyltransferase
VLFLGRMFIFTKGNRDMNKIFVALGFIALVITCTFAAREPLSLVFIIATFIIIGFGFGK